MKLKNINLLKYKRPFSMKNIEINKIAVSNNVSFGNNDFFIYFTGHRDTSSKYECMSKLYLCPL